MLAPALRLEARPSALAQGLARAQALLLTSRTAARALPPTDLPVLAVGEATAAEARRQGCRNVTAAAVARAEARIGSDPPSSTLRAAAKNRLAGCSAAASIPPTTFRPPLGAAEA